jgi:NitT/TauT family transport system substrate-binding protein
MKRATFATLAGSTLFRPRFALGQELPKVVVATSADESSSGVLWGLASGRFKNAGLDVSVQRSNNGAAVAAAVVGGSVQIGKSSVQALISAHIKGIPFVIIASAIMYDGNVNESGLLVARDGPIRTARDLNGKTMACAALNDLLSLAISTWMDHNGGDSKSVNFIEMPTAAAADAVATGRVAGAMVANPFFSQVMPTGKFREIGRPMSTIAKLFMASAFFTTADYLSNNNDVVARFRKAVTESAGYVNKHHAETAGALAAFSNVDPKVIASMSRAPLGTSLEPKYLQPVIDVAYQYKAINRDFNAREMLDPAALQ